ncbi:MAG: MFS transporter [Acidimicrobiales bacterium]|nr:MAG: MFS transporter [Acidimicrobiales bacterium]
MSAQHSKASYATAPFTRLARAHLASVCGDALFAMGLAGTIFFLSPAEAARGEVALYLLLTAAPFAVVAPLVGPTLDRMRGGRRWVIVASSALRGVMSLGLMRHLDSWLLYPEAFLMLVASRAHLISRSALVPSTVRSDADLVEANSKLAVISGVGVVLAAVPGSVLLWLGDARWVLGLAGITYLAASVLAYSVADTTVAVSPPASVEQEELRSRVIRSSAAAMASLRWMVGLVAFSLAFQYKEEAPALLAVVAGAAQVGFLAGAFVAPRLRSRVSEEHILSGSLAVTAAAAGAAALVGGSVGSALVSFAIAGTSTTAKQSFDALVQRDAPDANRGRSFARFEARFQLFWVAGGLSALLFDPSPQLVRVLVVVAATLSAGMLLVGIASASDEAAAHRRTRRRFQRDRRERELARRLGLGLALGDESDERGDLPGGPDPERGSGHSAGGDTGAGKTEGQEPGRRRISGQDPKGRRPDLEWRARR